jgi:hypothetical protein
VQRKGMAACFGRTALRNPSETVSAFARSPMFVGSDEDSYLTSLTITTMKTGDFPCSFPDSHAFFLDFHQSTH